ncbi:MAG: phospho-sugar mutase [Clostridia bacterium]|nr:phospho-sugar mutase [Clostridia bacterium]
MLDYMKEREKWLNSPVVDDATKKELSEIKDEKEIMSRFYSYLEFGTAGLRGTLGAGTNRMNIYVVRHATQGFANLIKSVKGEEKGVVIGHDCRIMSKEFALEAALVLAANGIKSYLFEDLRPTPEISFAIRECKAIAGINVTASHNPKEYNGYKVYWDDGAQLPPDEAAVVLSEIDKLDIFDDVKTVSYEEGKDYITYLSEEIDNKYIEKVKEQCIDKDVIKKVSKELKILYTPFHGTGYKLVPRILTELGFENICYVDEQMIPDGNFPTVKSPNPENTEGFKMAIEKGEKIDADIIIGTDPDADRVAAVVKDKDGKYKVLTGNQTGSLMLDYIINARRKKNTLPENACAIKTIVSTEMVAEICKQNNIELKNVLTGFKFIGEKIKEFEASGEFTYIFGFEESIGYLVGTYARDKDAVVGTMMIAEMAAYYKTLGMTLYDGLEKLYEKYGYFIEKTENMYFEGIEGKEKMKALMESFRKELPEKIGGLKVVEFRDYLTDEKIDISSGEKSSTGLPKSNVLYYLLEKDVYAIIRPSGTEPKIKLYLMAKGESKADVEEKVDNVAKEFLSKI